MFGSSVEPELYIELFADEWQQDSSSTIFSQRGPRISSLSRACISIPEMLNRVVDCGVVLGEPGAGKTTLLQWIDASVKQGSLADFTSSILISLRSFSLWLDKQPDVDLLTYHFQASGGLEASEAKRAAVAMREQAKGSKRDVLLLDGWDEVPNHLREPISRLIQRELPSFLILLSSRASGLPQQLFSKHRPKYFEIAGLSPSSIRDYVTKRLIHSNKESRIEPVLNQIESNRELSGVASNPFLLSLLLQILANPNTAIDFSNRSSIYAAITSWMVTQTKEASLANEVLTGSHLLAMERFSSSLMFTEPSPRFAFTEPELLTALGSESPLPIHRSRFVLQIDLSLHLWSFLHATLQEYFAARGISSTQDKETVTLVDKMLLSESRVVSIEFFAGLNDQTHAICLERATHWLSNPDRFGRVMARLQRMAAAGGWKHSHSVEYEWILKTLWLQVVNDKEWTIARHGLETLAATDPEGLLILAVREPKLDARIQEAICDLVPPKLILNSGFFDRLHKQLKEFIVSRMPQAGFAVSVAGLSASINESDLSTEQLIRLLDLAKQTGSPQVAEAILKRLRQTEDETQRDECVFALATLAMRLSDASLVAILIESPAMPKELRTVASKTLCIAKGCGQRINPNARRELLEALHGFDPSDPRNEQILEALVSYPIRDGAEAVAKIALDRSIPAMTRGSACSVMLTVLNEQLVQDVVSSIQDEPNGFIVDCLVELALACNIVIPPDFIESRLQRYVDTLSTRHFPSGDSQVFPAKYLKLAELQDIAFRRKCCELLVGSVLDSLQSNEIQSDVSALDLSIALRKSPFAQALIDITPQVLEIAKAVFILGLEEKLLPLGRMQLAVELLRSSYHTVPILKKSVPLLLARSKAQADRKLDIRIQSLAKLILEVIADHDVGEIIELADRFELANDCLREKAMSHGLTIVGSRVYDVDGNLVASKVAKELAATTGGIETTLLSLAPSYKSAVMSYWLVKQRFNATGPKEVYGFLQQASKGKLSPDDADFVLQPYSREVPKYQAWRQALYRGIDSLKLSLEGNQFVDSLDLPRK